MPSGDVKKRLARPAIERVLERITVDEGGCWLWQGSTYPSGYGSIKVGSRSDGTRRNVATHIVTWESQNGPTPEGKELDHLCRVRLCCNPVHLEAVSHQVNCARRVDQEQMRVTIAENRKLRWLAI